MTLAEAWSSGNAVPSVMVLRNLCAWAMAGGFPDGAFTTAAGEKVDPFDIYMSRRAMSAGPGRSIVLDGTETWCDGWQIGLIEVVLVSERAVVSFCEHTNTARPLLRGLSRIWAIFQSKNFTPPACPAADEHAATYQARSSAAAGLNTLRTILAQPQGKPSRYVRRSASGASSAISDLVDRWTRSKSRAQVAIHHCGDTQLQHELDNLVSEWGRLVSAEMLHQPVCPSLSTVVDSHAGHDSSAETEPAADRTSGQYSNGKLEAWYLARIARHEAQGTIPSRNDDWEAAKAEVGSKVPREAVFKLRGKNAPESWTKKGRRKSAEESDEETAEKTAGETDGETDGEK